MAVAHIAINFVLRNKCGNRVNDHNIHRARAHKCFGNFKSLFAVIRLRNEKRINVDAECLGVHRVKACSASINAASPPSFCTSAMTCRATVVLPEDSGPVDFNDSSARHTADAERHIERQRSGRNGADIHGGIFAELHDRAFAIRFFNLAQALFQALSSYRPPACNPVFSLFFCP